MRDFGSDFLAKRALSPVALSSNTAMVSEIIDTANFESLEFLIASSTLSDGDATFTTLVEHGAAANLSDNAAVADADLISTEAVASFDYTDDDKVKKIGYKGGKRYVRVTITPASNSGTGNFCIIAVLGNGRKQPQS